MTGASASDGSPLDRLTLMPIVMEALLTAGASPLGDHDEVGTGRIVAGREGVVAGLPVGKEVFGRFGVRCRPSFDEGDRVRAGDVVARLGGPLAAMRAAAPVAIEFLERLSSVASGARDPGRDEPLERYAAGLRLSAPGVVGDDGPSFDLVIDDRSEGAMFGSSAEAP